MGAAMQTDAACGPEAIGEVCKATNGMPEDAMNCERCGAKLSKHVNACPVCGMPIAVANAQEGDLDLFDDLLETTAVTNQDDRGLFVNSDESTQAHGTTGGQRPASVHKQAVDGNRAKARQASARRCTSRSSTGLLVASAFVILAAAVAFSILVLPRLLGAQGVGSQSGESDSQGVLDEIVVPVEAMVPFSVVVPGLDAYGSRIPVHVVGAPLQGEPVDMVSYLEADGSGLKLPSGEYVVTLAGSPVSAEGAVYLVPGRAVTVTIDKIGVVESSQEDAWELMELDALETPREAIDQALAFVATDPARSLMAGDLQRSAYRRIGIDLAAEESAAAAERQQRIDSYNNQNTGYEDAYDSYNTYTPTYDYTTPSYTYDYDDDSDDYGYAGRDGGDATSTDGTEGTTTPRNDTQTGTEDGGGLDTDNGTDNTGTEGAPSQTDTDNAGTTGVDTGDTGYDGGYDTGADTGGDSGYAGGGADSTVGGDTANAGATEAAE